MSNTNSAYFEANHIIKSDNDVFSYPSCQEVIEYILTVVDSDSKTLETGAGLSTVTFASRGARHICIEPNLKVLENISAHCASRGVCTKMIEFLNARSEKVLPVLSVDQLDLVLIDSNHAFPVPFLDFYYVSPLLKVGGSLIIDDINIWTGRTLKDFLLLEPEWELITEIPHRAAIFKKTRVIESYKKHSQQAYVMLKSDIHARYYPLVIRRLLISVKRMLYRF